MRGNPKVAAMESEAVRWVRYCSVSDANWKSALKRLTDAELGYCLKWENRSTGRKEILREADRRGVGTLYLQVAADGIEPEGNELEVGFKEPPGNREVFNEPFIGEAGGGKFFLTMRSSRKGRRCVSRSFTSEEEAMARAEQLMGIQVIDIEPEGNMKDMKVNQTAEVQALDGIYQAGRRDADKATALLESSRTDYEAIGKIKAANFNIKTNKLLKFVTFYQIKQNKEYKKAGLTWAEFCQGAGESDRTVDRILSELTPILKKISASQAEILGMPLSKIRFLGKAISACEAEISGNAIVIDDQRIEIIPENKDDIEAAIDLMKESREKERAAHAKQIEKLEKKLENAATEETKGLKIERDSLVKEIARLKVFDPEEKDLSWSVEQMKAIQSACSEFVLLISKFSLDDRLKDHVELHAEVEKFMSIAERSLIDLKERWDDRFNSNFGD